MDGWMDVCVSELYIDSCFVRGRRKGGISILGSARRVHGEFYMLMGM